MLQAMNIPDGTAAVDKELEKLPARQMTEVNSNREVILEAQKRGEDSPFCDADGQLSSQVCGTTISEISRPDCSPR